jgi:hypothetical protein
MAQPERKLPPAGPWWVDMLAYITAWSAVWSASGYTWNGTATLAIIAGLRAGYLIGKWPEVAWRLIRRGIGWGLLAGVASLALSGVVGSEPANGAAGIVIYMLGVGSAERAERRRRLDSDWTGAGIRPANPSLARAGLLLRIAVRRGRWSRRELNGLHLDRCSRLRRRDACQRSQGLCQATSLRGADVRPDLDACRPHRLVAHVASVVES